MEAGEGGKKSNPIQEAAKFSSSSLWQNANFARFLFWPENLEFVFRHILTLRLHIGIYVDRESEEGGEKKIQIQHKEE